MALEFDDRALNIIGNNVKSLNFYDDDRTLQARIFLDENNRLNIGNFQTEGGENGTGGGSLDLSDVGFLTIAATGSLNQERIFTAGNGITASDNGGNSSFTVSVKESEIDHDALLNFVADEHVAHTAVTISAGNGLTGGGDITASRTINLDTPGTLSVSSSNSATGNHTHAITASANPGAAAALLKSTASGGLTLELLDVDNVRLDGTTVSATAGDLTLDAAGGDVLLPSAVNIGADNFASETTGWRIDYDGSADFRDIFADELRVRAFIADIEQALAGGQIVSKSVALLSRDFVVPLQADIVDAGTTGDWVEVSGDQTGVIDVGESFNIAGSTGNDGTYSVASVAVSGANTRITVNEDITDATADGEVRFRRSIFVEDLPGFPDTAVFAAGDWLRLRVIDRSGGGLVVADVWGTVSSYSDLAGGEQTWDFTCRDDGGVAGDTVYAGALALDYGASGDGYWEVTALGNDVPYSQIVTWATDPSVPSNHTMQTRVGNLDGVTDADFPTIGGFGFYSDNAFLKGDLWAASGDVVIDSDGIAIKVGATAGITGTSSSAVNFVSSGSLLAFVHAWVDAGTDSGIRVQHAVGGGYLELNENAITGTVTATLLADEKILLQGAVETTSTVIVGNDLAVGTNTLFVDESAKSVGINEATPSFSLDVLGSFRTTLQANLQGGAVVTGDFTVDTDTLFVDASADAVGLGTATPGFLLDGQQDASGYVARLFNDGNASNRNILRLDGGQDSNPSHTAIRFGSGNDTNIGGVVADGAGGVDFTSVSDEGQKDDITPLPAGALTRILALEPVTYRGKGAPPERGKRTGLIAQQVQQHVPDVVSEGEGGLLGISYGRLVPELIGAIQELEAEVQTLRGNA